MRSMIVVACAVSLGACGLERDWDAFLAAAKGPTESGQSTDAASTGADTSSGASAGMDTVAAASSGAADTEGTASAGVDATGVDATSSSDDGSGAASTSGGEAPVCGDGVVNQDFEECDDGNLDDSDRCASTCQRARLIFVTSTLLQGKMSGLQGADAYCKSLALAAMKADLASPITDPGNFKALLTTSTQTIHGRHFNGKGPYKLVNGLPVSDSFAALFSAPLHNPINVDERSQTQNAAVWTGAGADGSPYPGVDFCADWTSNTGSNTYGWSDEVDSDWIFAPNEYNPEYDCISERPIYCLEQE